MRWKSDEQIVQEGIYSTLKAEGYQVDKDVRLASSSLGPVTVDVVASREGKSFLFEVKSNIRTDGFGAGSFLHDGNASRRREPRLSHDRSTEGDYYGRFLGEQYGGTRPNQSG